MVTAGEDGTCKIWNSITGECLQKIKGNFVNTYECLNLNKAIRSRYIMQFGITKEIP